MSFAALLWKDARLEARGKESVQAALVLVGLFLLVDLYAFKSLDGQAGVAAAVLWVPLVFGSAALAARSLASEADRGTLVLLRSAPVPLAWHGWSRTLVHVALIGLLAATAAALAAGLFGTGLPPLLLVALALAVPGLAVVATLASGLAAQARMRDALLPILLVPVLAPLLHSGVEATRLALSGAHLADARSALLLMAGYDLLAIGFAWLLWPVILEAD
jgi:heme exporter protein B